LKYRIIGDTDLKVSVIGIDVWANAVSISPLIRSHESDKIRFLQEAAGAGIALFDTGHFWKDGYAERILNKAVKQLRHEIIIGSKCGCSCGRDRNLQSKTKEAGDVSAEFIRRSCEESLRALGTDYIDIYQIQCIPEHIYLHERSVWLETLQSLVKEGKIRHIGLSTDVEQTLMDKYLNDHVDVIQVPYNILDRRLLDDLAEDKEIIPNSVICKDLTGEMLLNESNLLINDQHGVHPSNSIDIALSQRMEKIRNLALCWDVPVEQIALGFCLKNSYVCSALPVFGSIGTLMDICNGVDEQEIFEDLMCEAETI
tara:strand:+ start:177 stop:1115 length:939 start_codon:yes stop_codon:yes gene_type:complete